MNKKLLLVGSFAFFQIITKAQTVSEKVNKTELEVVYSHYLQDGNNSAITGGIGTERLTVYGPSFNLKRTWGKNALSVNLGADIISSASTDNIDMIMSSASRLDARNYAFTTYERTFDKSNMLLYGGVGLSIESDYFSVGSKIGIVKEDKNRLTTYSVQFQMFKDDLRWGRINPGYLAPTKLIYPSELRFQEWYDVHKRNSYNLKIGYSRAINKKNILGFYPEITYQEGLLETPFHRIYFSDGTLGVEQLPNKRFKGALAIKLNSFALGNLVIKNTVNSYIDNFGITAFSFENETAIKLKPEFILLPNFRVYTQTASKYFASFFMHESDSKYYTSDFDLSKFQTVTLGLGMKIAPNDNFEKRRMILNLLVFRYNFMYRTNGLRAHVLSLSIQTQIKEKNKLR